MEPTTIIERAFVRVVIVDDALLVRERLKASLHHDVSYTEVVGETGEAQAAIRLTRDMRPDMVILDLQLAGTSGCEMLPAVKLPFSVRENIKFTPCPMASSQTQYAENKRLRSV